MSHVESDLTKLPLSDAGRAFLDRKVFGHFIDGEHEPPTGDLIDSFDPTSGSVFAQVASGTPGDLDRAVQSARSSFEDGRWRSLAPEEKEKRLRKWSELIDSQRHVLRDLDILDGGVIAAATPFYAQVGIEALNYYAGWPTKLKGSVPPTAPDIIAMEVREPVGVYGLITPWNGPSVSSAGAYAAIACGNSVVMKPAEQTGLAPIFIAELAIEAGIPPGVFNVVQGFGHSVGAALVEHESVDAIGFVGSLATGRRIQASAAARVKRIGLELGGKSPHIIFDDADLNEAAITAANAVWGHSGQVCTAGSRVIVQRGIYDEFVAQLVECSKDLKIGSAFSEETQIGPLISQQQLDRVCSYVELGNQQGAEIVLGGERVSDQGYFHQPTIFANVDNRMTIAQEEIFGPVMTVIPFDSEAQAISIANDSEFGLSAGVWTKDLSRAQRMSQALRVGTVWINSYQLVSPGVSYGGRKQSGFGRTFGPAMLDNCTQTKTVWMKIG